MCATCVQYVQGTFKIHAEIAKEVATAAPYKEWVNSNHRLEDLVPTNQYLQETQMELSQVLRLQAANGMTWKACVHLLWCLCLLSCSILI